MPPELKAIQALLWEEWDPIGVNDISTASDEYDRYAGEVYSMLSRGADADEIARHLSWSVRTRMGIGASDEDSLKIARRALAIYLGHTRI